MEQEKNNRTALRIFLFILVGLGLPLLYTFLRGNQWNSSAEFHSIIETSATLLALFIGILALVNYYAKKDGAILFIGAGFLGTAFLGGFHGIVTSSFFIPCMPSDNISLIPWSWLAPRLFLSIYLFLSFLAWRKENKSVLTKPLNEKIVYIVSITLTLASFLFFAFVPLPQGIFSNLIFHRPEEYIPAIFFAFALIGYLQKGHWKYNAFEFWLVMSLIVGFISQAVYMPYSENIYDLEFNIAHILIVISYIFMLIGLMVNMYYIYQQVEVANKAKSDFLNIMSHELRTPLTVILGYTPLLSNPGRLPATKKLLKAIERRDINYETITEMLYAALAEYSKFTDKMDTSGKHLLTLINDMLDLSKIEANMMVIDPTIIKISPIIKNISKQFEKSAEDKGLSLTYTSCDEEIYADDKRLTQILINLVGNAIKFTDKGIIDISVISKQSFVEFAVSDTGCGISNDNLINIFDQFTQIDSTATRNIGGSGLGLTITKRLVELHGGQIVVNSKIGQGTTFKFTIPRVGKDK